MRHQLPRVALASLALLGALALAACSGDTPEATPTTEAPATAATSEAIGTAAPSPSPAGFGENRGPTVIIDWVNFLHLGDVSYHRSSTATQIDDSRLGAQFGTVEFKVADNVFDPSYQVKHGDAAFLPVGTPIFELQDYAPTFRLVARTVDGVELYEADSNRSAVSGRDLLDLEGKIVSIGLLSDVNLRELTRITDADVIAGLVAMVLDAPVNHSNRDFGEQRRVFISFHFADGTEVTRVYRPEAGILHRGIMLPPAFATAIDAALGEAH